MCDHYYRYLVYYCYDYYVCYYYRYHLRLECLLLRVRHVLEVDVAQGHEEVDVGRRRRGRGRRRRRRRRVRPRRRRRGRGGLGVGRCNLRSAQVRAYDNRAC